MKGTKASSVYFYDHAYLIIEVSRCSGATCASDEEVTEWLKGKKIFMRLINNKIDVSTGEPILRQFEEWLPTIPMDKFTDTGYRYRKNFHKAAGTYMEVFDYSHVYNHDEFYQEERQGGMIGEFYFRWADEQVMHQVSMQFPEEICMLTDSLTTMASGITIDSVSSALAPYLSILTLGSLSFI